MWGETAGGPPEQRALLSVSESSEPPASPASADSGSMSRLISDRPPCFLLSPLEAVRLRVIFPGLPSHPGCREGAQITEARGSLSLASQCFCPAQDGGRGGGVARAVFCWRRRLGGDAFWCLLGRASFNNRKWEASQPHPLTGNQN